MNMDGVSSLVTGICLKLDLTVEALNSPDCAGPVNGWLGTEVARQLADRYDLDLENERLGQALLNRGVLNAAEVAWLES